MKDDGQTKILWVLLIGPKVKGHINNPKSQDLQETASKELCILIPRTDATKYQREDPALTGGDLGNAEKGKEVWGSLWFPSDSYQWAHISVLYCMLKKQQKLNSQKAFEHREQR